MVRIKREARRVLLISIYAKVKEKSIEKCLFFAFLMVLFVLLILSFAFLTVSFVFLTWWLVFVIKFVSCRGFELFPTVCYNIFTQTAFLKKKGGFAIGKT